MSSRPPELEYKIGTRSYTLTFDLDGFERVEETTGLNLFNDEHWTQVNASAKIAKAIAWSFLHTAHPDLELNDLGKAMSVRDVRALTGLLIEGMRAAMPEAAPVVEQEDEDEEDEEVEGAAPLAGATTPLN